MFGENLKEMRKAKNLSQEELAEKLNISRQAVSRWEANQGYPEVEMLLNLADILDCSLDYLMYGKNKNSEIPTGRLPITIYSPEENLTTICYSVQASEKFRSKDEPAYALFAVTGNQGFSEKRMILGWYENEENIKKEISEIYSAVSSGASNYTLRYNCKVSKSFGKIKIVK